MANSMLQKMTTLQRAKSYAKREEKRGEEQYGKFKSYKQYLFYITEMYNAPNSFAIRNTRKRAKDKLEAVKKRKVDSGEQAELLKNLQGMKELAEDADHRGGLFSENLKYNLNRIGSQMQNMPVDELMENRTERAQKLKGDIDFINKTLGIISTIKHTKTSPDKHSDTFMKIQSIANNNKEAIRAYRNLVAVFGEIKSGVDYSDALRDEYGGKVNKHSLTRVKEDGTRVYRNISKRIIKEFDRALNRYLKDAVGEVLESEVDELERMIAKKGFLAEDGSKITIAKKAMGKKSEYIYEQRAMDEIMKLETVMVEVENGLLSEVPDERFTPFGQSIFGGNYRSLKAMSAMNQHPLTATVMANFSRYSSYLPNSGKFIIGDAIGDEVRSGDKSLADAMKVVQQWVYGAIDLYLGSDYLLADLKEGDSVIQKLDRILAESAYLSISFKGGGIYVNHYGRHGQ